MLCPEQRMKQWSCFYQRQSPIFIFVSDHLLYLYVCPNNMKPQAQAVDFATQLSLRNSLLKIFQGFLIFHHPHKPEIKRFSVTISMYFCVGFWTFLLWFTNLIFFNGVATCKQPYIPIRTSTNLGSRNWETWRGFMYKLLHDWPYNRSSTCGLSE